MKSKGKINAKLNLTLDVVGANENFHQINSLVAEIKLFDFISIKKRKDKKITLTVKGERVPIDEQNNAYKSAKAFMEKYSTNGVDIFLKKKIPVGGGLGGSSADIALVIKLMKGLYEIQGDEGDLYASLGSDVNYMANGGYAVLTGRGEKVRKIRSNKVFYLILAVCEQQVSAKDCYREYDSQGVTYKENTEKAEKTLLKEDYDNFIKCLGNHLFESAIKLSPKIKENYLQLKNECENVYMTGSGSTVYAIFTDKKQRDISYKKLKSKMRLIKTQTVIR